MLTKLRLRDRILLGYSFPLCLLLGLSSVAFVNSQRTDVAYKRTIEAGDASELAHDTLLGVLKVDRTVRSILILGNQVNLKEFNATSNRGIKESFEKEVSDYKKKLQATEKLLQNSPQQKQRLARLRKIAEQLEQSQRELINLVVQNSRTEAVRKYAIYQSRNFILDFENLQREVEIEQDRVTKAATDEFRDVMSFMGVITGLGTLLAVSISIVISYALSSGIAKTILDAANAVASSVKDITTTIDAQEDAILQQSASVDETTITIEEVGASSLISAQKAEISTGGAQKALDLAEEGTKTVGVAMDGIAELKDQVIIIANQIVRLSEQTSQITTVSDLVADLASQTNMLALNAGVEAARAGEHGKGFAVVASEIRKLADQSRKSADRIHLLVNEVQAAINSTIMVTDEGTKKATQGIRLAEETGDVFINIADAVNRVFLNNQEISVIAKQQAVAVQRVVAAMNAINLEAKETVDAISQVKEVTEDLNEAAQNLQAVL